VKKVETGYNPRPLQLHLHNHLKRFNVVVCHRRFGKTVCCINEIIDQALRNNLKNPQYGYIAPTYGAVKRIAWQYLKDYTQNIPGVEYNEAELRCTIQRPGKDKIVIWLLGAENPASLRGIYLDGVILDEYAEMDPSIFGTVIRPTLSDRRGWCIFVGTPKGANHFFELFSRAKADPDWYTALYRASETGVIPKEELDSARKDMPEDEYLQEYECSWSAALTGAYFAKQIEVAEIDKRITKVPHDQYLKTYTAWDLGIGDTTAIWFYQMMGMQIRFIDYMEDSGRGLDHYANELLAKKYNYDEHCLPHDAQARELGTGRSRIESLRMLKVEPIRILPRLAIDDRISAARSILGRCWFDEDKCARGLTALKNYQKSWDAKNRIFSTKPKHDWASHAADAFGYAALSVREDRSVKKNLPRRANSSYDIFNR
jgi:phage terminase large subunit